MITVTLTANESEKLLPFVFSGRVAIAKGILNTNPPLEFDMNYVDNRITFDNAFDFTIENKDGGSYIVINEPKLRDFYYINDSTLTVNILKA